MSGCILFFCLTALIGCYMTGATWNCCRRAHVLCTLLWVHVCLAVTCHLHFWQNDRDILRVTTVTRGWDGYRNKSQQRSLPWGKEIFLCSWGDSNPLPFGHESDALTTELFSHLVETHNHVVDEMFAFEAAKVCFLRQHILSLSQAAASPQTAEWSTERDTPLWQQAYSVTLKWLCISGRLYTYMYWHSCSFGLSNTSRFRDEFDTRTGVYK